MTGQPLLSRTADGGTSHTLPDITGRSVWTRCAEGTVTIHHYEGPNLPGRLISVSEQAANATMSRVCQFYVWGGSKAASRNLAGSPVQVWDNAGVTETLSMSLTGVPLEVKNRLVATLDGAPDWQGNDAHWQAQLEPTTQALVMRFQTDAIGKILAATNAQGVTTHTL